MRCLTSSPSTRFDQLYLLGLLILTVDICKFFSNSFDLAQARSGFGPASLGCLTRTMKKHSSHSLTTLMAGSSSPASLPLSQVI
ncbi:unnamed protein product [Victoria cruziana]